MSPPNKEAQIALPAALQDRLNSKCLDIIDQAFAVARTAADLSNAPTSAEVALRLKEHARSLKRSCNRLIYKLARRSQPS